MTLYHADQVQEAVNDSHCNGRSMQRYGPDACPPIMPDEEATAEQIAAALLANPALGLAVLEALNVVEVGRPGNLWVQLPEAIVAQIAKRWGLVTRVKFETEWW